MKKLYILVLTALIAIVGLSSCTKEEVLPNHINTVSIETPDKGMYAEITFQFVTADGMVFRDTQVRGTGYTYEYDFKDRLNVVSFSVEVRSVEDLEGKENTEESMTYWVRDIKYQNIGYSRVKLCTNLDEPCDYKNIIIK